MINKITTYYNSKQGILPIFISDFLNICDPVLTFDEFMEGIDLCKYLKKLPEHKTGRIRYNPVNMLKTVLFGFMSQGYISLRELEDNCKVNIRFMYLMDNERPSYRTFGYFINEVLNESIEDIFNDINKAIFEKDNVDLNHIYIDGSKFEANANKYSWVWKKSTEKSRYRLYEKITTLFNEMNIDLACSGLCIETNTEYIPDQLHEISKKYVEICKLNTETFVYGKGKRKTVQQRQYEKLLEYTSIHEEVIRNLESIHGALLRMNRSIQAEGTFGVIKNNRNYKRIIRKGIKSVKLEIFLVSIGHNLYKYHNKKMKLQKTAA